VLFSYVSNMYVVQYLKDYIVYVVYERHTMLNGFCHSRLDFANLLCFAS
jgi:hypothetical protein